MRTRSVPHRAPRRRRGVLVQTLVALLTAAAALVVTTGSASAALVASRSPQLPPAAQTAAGGTVGPWTQVGRYSVPTLTANQGLAFVQTKTGQSVIYRGDASIPPRLYLQGWQHIGDPGARAGYLVDAYQQGASTATSKLFEVTTPTGRKIDLVHPLAALTPPEQYNNSFATVSPDGQWLVSGEWNDMSRLLVFHMPSATDPSGPLPLAGTITLNHVVRNVQGCDFVTGQQLLCSSDEADSALFGVQRPLLQVDLATTLGPNAAGTVTSAGTVTALGSLPQQSVCTGTFETEGIAYAAPNDLRVEMIPPSPCSIATTTVYQFRRS